MKLSPREFPNLVQNRENDLYAKTMVYTVWLVFVIKGQKSNLAKYCILAVVQSYWRLKTIGDTLEGDTNNLQDFISDPHSYPVSWYTPQLHNHSEWGIIVKKLNRPTYDTKYSVQNTIKSDI